MRFTRRHYRCSTHATQHTGLEPQRTRHHSRGVSIRRTPAAAGASQPRSLLRRRTTTAGVSVRRKPAAAGAPFVHTEGDWPCLSPLVGSCLRRDTPEAAAILGKSLSAIASTEELVLTASSVLLVLPASSVHHADYTIAITQRRFTTEYPSSYPPRAISLRISSSSSQLAHETSTADSRRFTSHGPYASSSKVGKDIYMVIS